MPELMQAVGKLVGEARRAADSLQQDVRSELAKVECEVKGTANVGAGTGSAKLPVNVFASVLGSDSSQEDLILSGARSAIDREQAFRAERDCVSARGVAEPDEPSHIDGVETT